MAAEGAETGGPPPWVLEPVADSKPSSLYPSSCSRLVLLEGQALLKADRGGVTLRDSGGDLRFCCAGGRAGRSTSSCSRSCVTIDVRVCAAAAAPASATTAWLEAPVPRGCALGRPSSMSMSALSSADCTPTAWSR